MEVTHVKNKMAAGHAVSAKGLSFGKSNQARGKSSTRTPSQSMQEVEEQHDPIERHEEHR